MAQALKMVTGSPAPLKVETGVPLPHGCGRNRSALMDAIRDLGGSAIGASLFVPANSNRTQGANIGEYAQRHGGKGWVTIRKIEGGYRIWKIAEPKVR